MLKVAHIYMYKVSDHSEQNRRSNIKKILFGAGWFKMGILGRNDRALAFSGRPNIIFWCTAEHRTIVILTERLAICKMHGKINILRLNLVFIHASKTF